MKEFIRKLLSTPTELELKAEIRKLKNDNRILDDIIESDKHLLEGNLKYIGILEKKLKE